MFILQFLNNPVGVILFLLSVVIAVSVHEFMHAKTADKLGDPTPELAGRVTLDPRAHLDPLGSFLFLMVGFGWGKPVPFDPFNLDNPRKDAALISLAGPMSNFVMALLGSIIIRLIILFELYKIDLIGSLLFHPTTQFAGSGFLEIFVYINIVLGIFNLLPIAPLDGFKIVGGMLSEHSARQWYSLERYGILFLLFFIFPFAGGRSMLEVFVSPVIGFIINLFLP
ncbi:hypothetical protein A3H80_01395 [Candidatus Roizmanbacteria bacterium RIFCSPLOWO2_02_FULL_37_19]|uniref:Peptidase M50 domain-containing protein n=1 Tax=Candidatus Roizmanbacteria bacterium RIFCSPHIGHO2_02_FULL_37_24 TaxID=1802037 RepID=A0A1F7GV98_9BACT|nr:MAG: hypothetical protein A2862_01415 [Candidatus Roizmanbacteria bacterium RIFCSPHIGHO2_01_FULL_38_41]OGK23007.1 MAG: hypothetical protein A3C24_02610 [Candidatus Roizmanbacteria bacterium RIFCSPHIGHO2_02_FULL_37_24]OGK32767.1 MAG: hypothetical protein A3E10_01225 [Candidatus Roizmanbacteria bacterium RIFCSPHIGHO2_12_FULL_37_23]OGK53845.1 MAG: hypothetical protein A3H80_01395 [Candidatus Roizmanbacteria bacterium RIFCSPLOWO2_02_FULL_37_19]OGK60187.1 MAG: hypothetical protein A3G65_01880 [Ca